tara:strand:- start:436 stop:882 length:447 start_codon:yes stop_codon:yes gene_type:complete
MATINKVILVGNVGNVDFKEFDNGGKIVNMSLATAENYQKDGEWVSKTEWHRCTCGIPGIVERANNINKGDSLYVEGSIQTRKWTDKEGSEKEIKEIKLTTVRVVSKKRTEGEYQESAPVKGSKPAPKKSKPKTAAAVVDAMDDEMPF